MHLALFSHRHLVTKSSRSSSIGRSGVRGVNDLFVEPDSWLTAYGSLEAVAKACGAVKVGSPDKQIS